MKNEFKDPICGMTVTAETAAATLERDGVQYHFCSLGCHDKFLKTDRPAAAAASGKVQAIGSRTTRQAATARSAAPALSAFTRG